MAHNLAKWSLVIVAHKKSDQTYLWPKIIKDIKYENTFALFSDICWIRLDFDTFELASQTSERSNVDSFEMKESESLYNYPVLAGSNSGQHGKQKSIMCRHQQHLES